MIHADLNKQGPRRAPRGDWPGGINQEGATGGPVSHDTMYGRTEDEWQQREDAGWELLKERAAERPGDAPMTPPCPAVTRTPSWRLGQACLNLTSASKLAARRWATSW